MEAGDRAGGAAMTAPTWLVFFLFFQNAITCVKNGLLYKYGLWTMDYQ
jgi:hypothetical protein